MKEESRHDEECTSHWIAKNPEQIAPEETHLLFHWMFATKMTFGRTPLNKSSALSLASLPG